MKKQIPFLELASQHKALSLELQMKLADVLEKGVFSGGLDVDILESTIRDYLKVPYAIACSNGTDALEMALTVLGVGKGDEVIVPALTWVSTGEAVVNVGATPVFADVDEHGLLNLEEIPNCFSPNSKAVIPVHLYGKMVDMKRLSEISQYYNLKVIEDAAQAFGAFQEQRSAGAYGEIGCFSFYPTKNLGALGEAGLMVTKEEEIADKLRLFLNHGQSRKDLHEMVGRNAKIDTLQAAFLNVKLKYFQDWQSTRKKLGAIYLQELKGIKGMELPAGFMEKDHNAHLFTIRLEDREGLKFHLGEKGIGTAIHYPKTLPQIQSFRAKGSFPSSEKISRTTLSLPLHPFLTEGEVFRICKEIKSFFIPSFKGIDFNRNQN